MFYNFVLVRFGLVITVYIIVLLGSCKKETCNEIVPVISLTSADRTATNTIIKIQVRDCNGDIGLNDEDTSGRNRNNAFVDIRPFVNGEWSAEVANYVDSTVITTFDDSNVFVPVDTIYDTLNFYYRIPIIENNSISDIYDAEVELNVIASDFGFDTFRMEVKIRDQAFNSSNTVLTKQMIVQP